MIYLSGSISNGGTKESTFERFFEAEERLKAKGFEVINPARMQDPKIEVLDDSVEKWIRYMARDIKILIEERPTMYFLKGWEKSVGANIEHFKAKELGLTIEYE